jgi:hypothetical protein
MIPAHAYRIEDLFATVQYRFRMLVYVLCIVKEKKYD